MHADAQKARCKVLVTYSIAWHLFLRTLDIFVRFFHLLIDVDDVEHEGLEAGLKWVRC